MCTAFGNLAVKLDTGLLDSRDDLGFNSKQIDRIQYRKVTTCSPILSTGYVTNGTSTIDGRGYNYTAAFYGPNSRWNSSSPQFGGIPNATYIHSDYNDLRLQYDTNLSDPPYTLV